MNSILTKTPNCRFFLNVLLLAALSAAHQSRGADARTDLNPAFSYYQAFTIGVNASPTDHDYLFEREWRGQKLPEKFGELVSGYDSQFTLLRRAAQSTATCDWGIDMSPGPGTLLPHLARVKAVVQTARLRTMWDLQNGRQAEARTDLLSALALARNVSRDGVLISALVQIAAENIVYSTIAENFHRWSPQSLKELAEGIASAPPRGTVAACMPVEKLSFLDWLVNKTVELQKAHPGNDGQVMNGLQELVAGFDSFDEGTTTRTRPKLWEQVLKASGGNSDGVLKLLHDEESLYEQLATVLALPSGEYEAQMKPLTTQIQHTSNPFVSATFPAFDKCRQKEFAVLTQLAMLQAGIASKLRGEEGLKSVSDPCGNGPFQFQRFIFAGVDRGFELKGAYSGRGFPEAMIFVEKDGTPFHVTGPKEGQAVEQSSTPK